jgi:hypothetical protein
VTLREQLETAQTEITTLKADHVTALEAKDKEVEEKVNAGVIDAMAAIGPQSLDGEARTLAETARQLNEVNRRVRNLLAANVAARIEALGGPRRMPRATYSPARA